MSVTVHLEDDLDVARGDADLPRRTTTRSRPRAGRDDLLDGRGAAAAARALACSSTRRRTVRAVLDTMRYRLDVNTLHRDLEATDCLSLNDIGRVTLRTSAAG